jgi:hypothetical protein
VEAAAGNIFSRRASFPKNADDESVLTPENDPS